MHKGSVSCPLAGQQQVACVLTTRVAPPSAPLSCSEKSILRRKIDLKIDLKMDIKTHRIGRVGEDRKVLVEIQPTTRWRALES